MITKLPDEFTGKADVKGFKFIKYKESEYAYIFKVTMPGVYGCHYEVFEKIIYPVFEDFATKKKIEDQYYESYPKTRMFGKSAWCCNDLQKALNIFKEINDSKKK